MGSHTTEQRTTRSSRSQKDGPIKDFGMRHVAFSPCGRYVASGSCWVRGMENIPVCSYGELLMANRYRYLCRDTRTVLPL